MQHFTFGRRGKRKKALGGGLMELVIDARNVSAEWAA